MKTGFKTGLGRLMISRRYKKKYPNHWKEQIESNVARRKSFKVMDRNKVVELFRRHGVFL